MWIIKLHLDVFEEKILLVGENLQKSTRVKVRFKVHKCVLNMEMW